MKRPSIFLFLTVLFFFYLFSISWAKEPIFTLEIKNNLISLKAEQTSFKKVLNELEKKAGIKINIFNGVEDKKVTLDINNLPVYAIHTLLEKMALENFAVVYDTQLASKVIFILPIGQDIAEVLKGKTSIRPARFADGKNVNQIMGHEIITITRGKNNVPIRYVKDEVLLKFHLGVTRPEIEEVLKKHNLILVDDISLSKIGYVKAKIRDGREVTEVIKEVSNEYKVKIPEPNYIAGILTVNDPLYEHQWHVPDTNFNKAWSVIKNTGQLKVAVIDTGVNAEHPDLNSKILQGYDFVNNDSNATDDHGHGTFVTGIIAAVSNDIGIKGLYDYAQIVPVKVIDANGIGTYEDSAKGIIYAADNGAKVINLSIGGYGYSFMLQDAVDYALEKGCIVVAAGGNDGIEQEIYPAAYPDVIGVSALGHNGQIWSSSNSGRYIDFSAPGVDILSTGLDNDYVYATGTSASAPMVSALVAMLISERQELSSSVIERLIMQSAKDLGEKGRDKIYGSGEIDALASLQQEVKPFHDVTLRSVNVEPLVFEKDKSTYIVANIENVGTYRSENFDVVLYEIVGEEKNEIGRKEGVNVIDKTKVIFEWIPEGVKGNIKFEVTIFSKDDIDSSNNSKTSSIFSIQERDGLYILHAHPAHQVIAYKAYLLLPPNIQSNFIDYIGSDSIPTNSDYDTGATITEGTYDEDYPTIAMRSFNHFWNTTSYTTPHGQIDPDFGYNPTYQSAYRRAQNFWDDNVIPYYTGKDRNGNPHVINNTTSFWWLGRVAHLLTDMSVPAHTHNDPHVAYNYETYVNNNCSTNVNCSWTESGSPTVASNLYDLFLDMAELADDFDSEDYNGEVDNGSRNSCTWWGWCTISDADYQIIGNTLVPEAMRHVAALYKLFWAKTHPPIVNSFSVNTNSLSLGNYIKISYSVSDVGGSGLKQVELWRANDINGAPDPNWPGNPIQTFTLSGQTNYSGSFYDAPSVNGSYWYGIHVVDKVGNWNDEHNSKTGGLPGDYGPIKVTVVSDTTAPTVVSRNYGTSPSTNIYVKFSEDMNDTTFTNSTVTVSGSSSGTHSNSYSFNHSTFELTANPITNFSYGETVNVTIGTDVKDLAGNNMSSPYIFSFTIASSPPPPPTSISVSASANPSSTTAYFPITVSGTAIYNTGYYVTSGTASIVSGGNTWTAPINNGSFSTTVNAPGSSQNISVSASDGTLTGSTTVYITITGNTTTLNYNLTTDIVKDAWDNGSQVYWNAKPSYRTTDSDVFGFMLMEPKSGNSFTLNNWVYSRYRFYSPDGSLYGNLEDYNAFAPGTWGWYYNYYGYYVANNKMPVGRYTVHFYLDENSGNGWEKKATHYYVVGWDLTEHRMAKDIGGSPDYLPITPTNTFYATDSKALTWANFDLVAQSMDIKWEFYEPNGSLYGNYPHTSQDPGSDQWYGWLRAYGWIDINGYAAANKTGDWNVKVYVRNPYYGNYELKYTDYFKILENPAVSPTVNVSSTPTNPIETQSITVNVSATDNTYLKKVVLHWNDGSDHPCHTQDNIFSSSYSGSCGIGSSFAAGQQIEYWAEAWDTSGNRTESQHKTIIIQQEVIVKPNSPSGNAFRQVNQSGTYCTSGASTTLGHAVQYQFDWGNGTTSIWGSACQSHSWSSEGYNFVRVHARCVTHTNRISDWSSDLIVAIDSTPPSGTIIINSDALYIISTFATLDLSSWDASGVIEMQFSNDNINWSSPEPYTDTKSWTLNSGDGTKTVYAKFKDNVDNWSSTYSDTIVLDTSAPTTTVSPVGGTYNTILSVTLTCTDGVGSGCNQTYYCLGTGCNPTVAYNGIPVNISSSTDLRFYSTDHAGNVETVKTEVYSISITENDCFDGLDNDQDGMTDCTDSDCAGVTNGSCITGLSGICATGTLTCSDSTQICIQDNQTQQEGPINDTTCSDTLDNDCDGNTDGDDLSCQITITWSVKPTVPIGPRDGSPVIYNGKIHYVGGHNGDYSDTTGKRDHKLYDPLTDSWSTIASLPLNRGESGGTLTVADNNIFLFGGCDPPGSSCRPYIHKYDPLTNTWTLDVATFPYLTGGSVGNPVATFGNSIYVFGGLGNEPGVTYYHDDTFEFDPITYGLTPKTSMLGNRYSHNGNGGAYTVGNEIWLVWGIDDTATLLPVDVYNHTTDSWVAELATPPGNGITAMVDGKIYLITQNLSSAWVYDPIANQWNAVQSILSSLPANFTDISSVTSVYGELYALGGRGGSPDNAEWMITGAISGVSVQDSDNDSIPDDGDGSGIIKDNLCTGGNMQSCDDNCIDVSNPNQADMDSDGVGDACDNCREIFNPDQKDDNSSHDDNSSIAGIQHYGNLCDPDFDNDGDVGIRDFNEWRKYVGQDVPPAPAYIDLNNDGTIWIQDFNIWRSFYGGPPGPGIGD